MPSENGVHWKDPFFHLRGTGRTRRMLVEAIRLAAEGTSVVIWAVSLRHADQIANSLALLTKLDVRTKRSDGYECVFLPGRVLILSNPIAEARGESGYTVRGMPKHTVYFADHYLLETKEPWLLEQWEKFRNA